jgi:molecular chaperone GrpE (heat shock protein)
MTPIYAKRVALAVAVRSDRPNDEIETAARELIAEIDAAEDEGNGEDFADGIVRLTKENQALTEQLEAAKAELQTFRRQPGRARPLTDLELALLRRLEGK